MENKNFEKPPEYPEYREGVAMIDFAMELGFKESESMVKARERMVELLKMMNQIMRIKARSQEENDFTVMLNRIQDKFDYFYHKYARLAEDMVNEHRDTDDFKRAQIGHLIMEAHIFRAGGNMLDYEEKVDQALQYAHYQGYKDISDGYWTL